MNLVQQALNQLYYVVPRQVLEAAFIHPQPYSRRLPISLDTLIMDKVVRPRVMNDCNLVGGVETTIPLGGIRPEIFEDYSIVYNIPKQLTEGRSITTVLHLTYGEAPARALQMGSPNNSGMLSGAQSVVDGVGEIPVVSTADVRLIGENTVLIRGNLQLPTNVYLRCILEQDEAFSHIQPRSFPSFFKLVEYAVKAYIYNELGMRIDQSYLSGGVELGRIREVVDSYADANELYQTYMEEVWAKTSLLNDHESKWRHLKSITGGSW